MSVPGKPSRRFTPSKGVERIIPVLLVVLLLVLVGTILLVLLAALGLVPTI